MTLIDSLRTYFRTCPQLKGERLNVDFLPTKARSYTLDVVPCKELIKSYLDGSALKQFDFVLASRNYKTQNAAQNVENLAFYEDFSRWVAQENRRRNLPILFTGRTARKLEVTTSGYPFYVDDAGTARYQIQMKLTYFEKGNRA